MRQLIIEYTTDKSGLTMISVSEILQRMDPNLQPGTEHLGCIGYRVTDAKLRSYHGDCGDELPLQEIVDAVKSRGIGDLNIFAYQF